MPAARRQRGQSLTEFAMVVPLFLLLLLALVDFSRLLFTYVSLTNGTRELARSVAISSTPAATVVGAFNNLTIVGGPISPASSVTFTTPAGNTLTCTGASDPLCTITVATTTSSTWPNGTITLSAGGSSISYASSTSAPFNYSFNPSGNGDFLAMTWLAPDQYGLQQGYIQVCRLPFTTSCGFPAAITRATASSFSDGWVQVDVAYTFQFNPLFQNRLSGVVDVSFMRPSTLLTTSVRTYAE
jgi:Flp pilus assembly protein TadG